MNLKQLIEYLEKKDLEMVVPIGFDEPHSYRGDYMCLAFEPAGDVTVGAMLQCARDAIGSIYEGSNGAHYRMNLSTEVYLAIRGKSSEKIGTVLLDYMTGVYDSEECEHLRGVINRSTDEIAGLIVDRNNVRTDLASADAELFEYRKKIVEQSKAIYDLTTDTLVEERNDLNRWFINDRDTLRSIGRTCAELGMYNPDMKIRDVKAIKSMKVISNIMNEWDPNIGRAKEAESHSNGKDMLSAAVGAIRGIEAANLKTTNDLLRAHIENMNEEKEKINRGIGVMTGTISEQNDVIRKQNQTLLHIKAELEFIKQRPFDLVIVGGSIENMSRVIEGQTEPFIDDGCVESCKVCARSCKVVDIAAGLQEELESTRNMYQSSSDECCKQRRTIGDLRAELFDLKNSIPDNFWVVITEKDFMIRRQGKIIEDFKTIETRETDRLCGIIDEKNVVVDRLYKTIDELKDRNAEDLNELYTIDKAELSSMKHNYEIILQNRRDRGDKLEDNIKGLEAELSARKEDSVALKKVVGIVKNWEDDMHWDRTVMKQIATIVKDHTLSRQRQGTHPRERIGQAMRESKGEILSDEQRADRSKAWKRAIAGDKFIYNKL